MSHVIPVCEQNDLEGIDRSQFRLTTFAEEPVCLLFSVDGIDIDPVVEQIDVGRASFVCSNYFDMFYEGQIIGPAVLFFQDEGMGVGYPVVKSKNWPINHVEVMEISAKKPAIVTG